MDFEAYRKVYLTDPQPPALYEISGVFGFAIFIEDYDRAVAFYERVLGPPGYVEGANTRGWKIGTSWLTLLKAKHGSPRNMEIQLTMANEQEASSLQRGLVEAGGMAEEPIETLMYEPVKIFPVQDPFGTLFMLVVKR